MTRQTELEKRLNDLIRFITDATAEAHAGTVPELGNLDQDVDAVCEDLAEVKPDEVTDLPHLSSLMGEMISCLENLGRALMSLDPETESSGGDRTGTQQ